ncbi:MAG: tetratricopeptide repeat protein, partial [Candidatus Binatia bacterium]
MRKTLAFLLPFFWLTLPAQLHSQEGEPRELFSKAYALFSQGNLSQAKELFLKTLEIESPLEDYSLYFLGMIFFDRDELGSARNYFAQLKQRFPQSVWSSYAELQLAKISLAEKNYQQATQELRALRVQEASKREISDEALYLLAQVHEVQRELKEAYSLYQALRHTLPLSPWAAKARKDVKRLRKQHPQLFALTTPVALSDEGELLLREREYQEAERVYRKLLDRVPQGSLRPSFLMGLANVYRGSRKREKTISVLAKIEREYPESPEAPNSLYRR